MIRNIVLLIFISIQSLLAQAYEGEFTPLQSSAIEVEEGATFDGVIRIWPVKINEDVKIFDQVKIGKLNENFYLIEKTLSQRSTYNSEVVEIKGLFAVIKAIKNNAKMMIKVGDSQVSLDIRRISSIATAPPPQAFEFVDQPQKLFVKKNIPYFLVLVVLFIVLVFILIGIIKRARQKKRIKIKRELLINNIVKASERSDIELIPSFLKDLGYDKENDQYKNFKDYLDRIQYKQKWEDGDLANITKLKNEVINAGL